MSARSPAYLNAASVLEMVLPFFLIFPLPEED